MTPEFSVCICTRGRPGELRRAIASVLASDYDDWELVVSDDGRDDAIASYLSSVADPRVKYVRGPARGLGPNRNNCVRNARGEYVFFMDDDVVMHRRFLAAMSRAARAAAGAVVTGWEIKDGEKVDVPALDWLGYMSKAADPGDLEMVVMNAAVFPRDVFRSLAFDENIVFGYDEADIAAQVRYAARRRIVFCKGAVNYHFPAADGRMTDVLHASRIYVNTKKYIWLKKQYLRGIGVAALSFAHLAAHLARRAARERRLAPVRAYFKTVYCFARYWARLIRRRPASAEAIL
jgi:glycosyltransferase involved in cell wall biosynthesis